MKRSKNTVYYNKGHIKTIHEDSQQNYDSRNLKLKNRVVNIKENIWKEE